MSKPLIALLLLFGAAAAFLMLTGPSGEGDAVADLDNATAAEEHAAAPNATAAEAGAHGAAPQLTEAADAVGRRAATPLATLESAVIRGDAVQVSARLLDVNERPIAGGTVGVVGWEPTEEPSDYLRIFQVLDGIEVEGLPIYRAETGKDGVAVVEVPAKEEMQWVILATAEEKESGGDMLQIRANTSEHDAGDFVLGPAASVELEVVDEMGRGINRAAITMFGEVESERSIPFRMGITDADGKKAFQHLPPGEYQVGVVRPGYIEKTVADIVIAPTAPGRRRIALESGESLRGQVVDHEGTGVAGVNIYVRPENPDGFLFFGDEPIIEDPWAVTNESGRFSATGLAYDKPYIVRAQLGEIAKVDSGAVRAGEDVLLELPRTIGSDGSVLLADGRPAAGASVHLTEFSDRWWDASGLEFETNEQGVFDATLQTGKYRVTVFHSEAEESFEEALVVDDEDDFGEWKLPAAAALELTVVSSETGKPVVSPSIVELNYDILDFQKMDGADPQAMAELFEREEIERQQRYLLREGRDPATVDGGKIGWNALRPGWYRFRVSAPEFARTDFLVELVGGRTHAQTVELIPGCDLTLTVVDTASVPVKKFKFVLLPEPPADSETPNRDYENVLHGRTNNEGQHTFSELGPGRYQVIEEEDWGSSDPFAVVEVTSGLNEISVTLPDKVDIVVQVSDAEGPVAECQVILVPRSTAGAASNASFQRAYWRARENSKTDSEGYAEIENLRPGPYSIMVQPQGGWRQIDEIDIAVDGQQVDVLLEGFVLTGRVDPPRKGMRVRLSPVVRQPSGMSHSGALAIAPESHATMLFDRQGTSAEARTNSNGEFKFRYLDAGEYFLSATGNSWFTPEPSRISVVGQTQDVVMLVLKESHLVLRVSGLGSRSTTRYSVKVLDAQGRTVQSRTVHRDGDIRIRSMPVGSYLVQVRERGNEEKLRAEFPVSISPDHDTVLDWNPTLGQ